MLRKMVMPWSGLVALSGLFIFSSALALEFDQNVTPAHIATSPLSQNASGQPAGNGGFTVHRNAGVELGLRARLLDGDASTAQDAMIAPGVYRFEPGNPPGEPPGSRKPVWVFDWSVNVDYENDLSRNLNSLSYRIFLDGDPGIGTHFLDFDPLGASPVQVPFDIRCLIAFGNNQTGEGQGVSAGGLECPTSTIVQLRNNNNVMQNSCNYDCPRFDTDALENFDPNQRGIYTIVIQASANGEVVARSEIIVLVGSGLLDLELSGPASLIASEQGEFQARLRNIAEAATDEAVEVIFEIDGANGQPELVDVEYCADAAAGTHPACTDWQVVELVPDGDLLRGRLGPESGFPIDDDYDQTTFLRGSFAEPGSYQVHARVQEVDGGLALAVDSLDVEVSDFPFVVLSGFDSDTLLVEFSTAVVATGLSGDAAAWNGLDPAAITELLAAPTDQALFLESFFAGGAALANLIDDWSALSITGQVDRISLEFGAGLVDLSYALDPGNTGTARAELSWVGTGSFETGSGFALSGPEQPDFKLELTVPYSQETGADYAAAAVAMVIAPDTPLIRPMAPGIESGSLTIDPVSIDFAVGEFAAGLSAVYSFDGDDMGVYESGQVLNQVGDYVVVVTNDSNPGVQPGAQTTVRFTRESIGAGASGNIEVRARQSDFDGQIFGQGGVAHFEVAVEFVTVSPGLELVLMFDGDGPDGQGPEPEAVCAELLTASSCDALLAAVNADQPFVDDIVLFDQPIQVRADAALGEWTLNFFLLAVDGAGDTDLVSAASYSFEVVQDGLFSDRFQP